MKQGVPFDLQSAFEELYTNYGDRIYRFCYRLCGNMTDAEDLTQDVFVLAYKALPQFEGRASITTWLYKIAVHRWQRLQSQRGPETVLLEEDLHGTASANPAMAVLERVTLEEALAALPAPLRESFLLVKAEGLTYRETAEVLSVPQGTVQSRVHDAVLRLRTLLAYPG